MIAVDRDGKKYFGSVDFNHMREKLPRVIPDLCCKSMHKLCAGVMLYDIWIANEDRHDENLLVNNIALPTEMHVFDQDMALFGGVKYQGPERTKLLLNHLGITGGDIGGWRHIFLDLISDADDIYWWVQKLLPLTRPVSLNNLPVHIWKNCNFRDRFQSV
jgi:hypothetical protein